jgi:cardiolipin synthase
MPRALNLFLCLALACLLSACSTAIRQHVVPPGAGISRAFADELGRRLDAPVTEGNKVQELVNGVEIFPPMLAAIHAATNSITFENFIWHSGVLSDEFIEALGESAARGVDVRVVLDDFGTLRLKNTDEDRLRRSGIRLVKYNRLWKFWSWNHRTHRKLMVVDGRVAFIGGACIGDDWLGNAEHEPLWRDTHYRVEGPVVAQIQRVFETNWRQLTEQPLPDSFFPQLPQIGVLPVQCFESGPGEGKLNAKLTALESIRAATNDIRLAHCYFVPDRESVRVLLDARKRGVRVEIMTPGVIHANVVRRASRSKWKDLLEAGVEFYEFQPAAFHCKTLIVDERWVSVGSANFDPRSFHINDEANINVLDAEFARRQIELFEADKAKSQRITAESYRKRSPLWIRAAEKFYGLLSPLL